jgi:hypothetical protein
MLDILTGVSISVSGAMEYKPRFVLHPAKSNVISENAPKATR